MERTPARSIVVQDGQFRLAAFLRHPADYAARWLDSHIGVAAAGAS